MLRIACSLGAVTEGMRPIAIIAIAALLAACGAVVDQPIDPAIEAMKQNYARPTEAAPTPEDNQTTPQRVALGRQLFFDPRLSGSGLMSCSTCHSPNANWEDRMPTAIGRDGRILARSTPTILNAAWGGPFFWDGRTDTLEQQAVGPIAAPGEMNLPHDQAVARIAAIGGYRHAFAAAYSDEGVTIDTIGKALAAFERSIVSARAPFDRWVEGERDAISPAAHRGFAIFNTTGRCATCHSGWRFTDDGFHDIGVSASDEGRAAVFPGIEELRFAFKTPTLRNIDRRGPYMHDGSLRTLEEVIAFYNTPPTQRASLSPDFVPLHLSQADRDDLLAYLHTLTSDDPVERAPGLPQ